MKMKDLNPAEEGYFPCKLRRLEPSEREFNCEYNSGNCIIIGLAFLELGKVLLRDALYRTSFLAYAFWVHKNATPKTGLCGLKG